MTTERITGYSLLATGIIIMIFAAIQIIFVFTGKTQGFVLFKYEESTPNVSSGFDVNTILSQIQGSGAQGVDVDQMPNIQLIDPQILHTMLNLVVYYLIMQFLLGLGYKIATLGVQLVRPIQVVMKNKTVESNL